MSALGSLVVSLALEDSGPAPRLKSLAVLLTLEDAEYTQGLKRAEQASQTFAQRVQKYLENCSGPGADFMRSMVKGAYGAVQAMASVGSAIESLSSSTFDALKDAVNSMAALDDLMQKTGSSVENLSRLQQAASAFGQDFGDVDAALSQLANGMAGVRGDSDKVTKALKALGISAKDAAGTMRDPSEVFIEASKKLATYGDSADKTRLLNDLLGQSGANLLPYMNDVAESIDKFQGVNAEAAANAAHLQDQLGMARAKFEELAMQIAAGALPALNDLVSVFLESANEADGLTATDVSGWADDAAIGFAKVVDFAKLTVRTISAIGGSFKVVMADIATGAKLAFNAHPVVAITKRALGGDPAEDARKALAERRAVIEAANKEWADLANKPTDEYEQAMRKRIGNRKASTAGGGGGKSGKPTLKYSGKDGSSKEASDYANLNKSLQERIALGERELALGRPLQESEKELAAIQRGRAQGTVKLTDDEFAKLQVSIQQLEVNERLIASQKEAETLRKKRLEETRKAIEDATSEAERNEKLAETIGKTTAELNAASIARTQEQLAKRDASKLNQEEVDALERLIEAKRRSNAAAERVDELQGAKKGLDDLDAYLKPEKAKRFGDALRDAFGSAAAPLAALSDSLEDFVDNQDAIADKREAAAQALKTGLIDQKKYQQYMSDLNDKEAQDRLAGFSRMAGAAKGFFGEQSKGYKVLHAAEQAFHVAQLAMSAQTMVKKLFFKQTEVAATAAANTTKLAGEATTTAASTGLAATEASAWGVTAVVKAIASLPFPFNLAAGAATLAAVMALGAKVTGGGGAAGAGGKSMAEQRQAENGTGSILGDPTAKSESIAKSLEAIKDNTYQDLAISQGMLTALQAIATSISGLSSLLFRTDGFTAAVSGGVASGGILGKMKSSIFGGKTTVEDIGLSIGKESLASLLASGADVSRYVDTKKSGGWFHSDKRSRTQNALGPEINAQFTKVIGGLSDVILASADALGLSGDAFAAHLNSFVVDIREISTKDMKPDDVEKALNAAMSKLGDDMAKYAVNGLSGFQKVGEGYLETLTRIANNYQTVDVVLASLGMTFNSVGTGSIGARERLIELVGGLDDFTSKSERFLGDFYSDDEKAASLRARVKPTLDQYGLSADGEDAMKKFRNYVTGLDLTTASGAKAYATLIGISGAFKEIVDAGQDVLDERRDLQEQLDELTMTSSQLLKKQRDALDGSNRALFDQVQAAQAAKDAQQEAKDSLGNFISQMESFATTAAGLNSSLVMGELSMLTPQQQYAEARRQFEEIRRLAAAGDTTAQGKLSGAEQTFLQMSQKINGSDAQYSSDLAFVMRTNDELAQWAINSVDVAKASLDALNDSAATLADISATLKEIAQKGVLQPVLNNRAEKPATIQASNAIDYSVIGTSNMVSLVEEIKTLRASSQAMAAELKGLRADQQQQTGDLITSGAAATQQAAATVVEGVRSAVTDAAYIEANSRRDLS
ncbi:hypothetical protein [Pseudoduganella sp. HUAS MS19]